MSIRTDGVMAELFARGRMSSPAACAVSAPRPGIFARLARALPRPDHGVDGLDHRLRADIGFSHEIGWAERMIRRYVPGGTVWTGE